MGDAIYVELSDTYSELWFIDSSEKFDKCCKVLIVSIIAIIVGVLIFVYVDSVYNNYKEPFDYKDSIDYTPLPIDYGRYRDYGCHKRIRSMLRNGYIRPFAEGKPKGKPKDKPKDEKRVKWSDSLIQIKRI